MVSAQDFRSRCKISRTEIQHIIDRLAEFDLSLPLYSTSGILTQDRRYKPITKYDWTLQKLDDVWQNEQFFQIREEYNSEELDVLKLGYIPDEDINLFIYYESGILNIYNPANGQCLYRIWLREDIKTHLVLCYNIEDEQNFNKKDCEDMLKDVLRKIIDKSR